MVTGNQCVTCVNFQQIYYCSLTLYTYLILTTPLLRKITISVCNCHQTKEEIQIKVYKNEIIQGIWYKRNEMPPFLVRLTANLLPNLLIQLLQRNLLPHPRFHQTPYYLFQTRFIESDRVIALETSKSCATSLEHIVADSSFAGQESRI